MNSSQRTPEETDLSARASGASEIGVPLMAYLVPVLPIVGLVGFFLLVHFAPIEHYDTVLALAIGLAVVLFVVVVTGTALEAKVSGADGSAGQVLISAVTGLGAGLMFVIAVGQYQAVRLDRTDDADRTSRGVSTSASANGGALDGVDDELASEDYLATDRRLCRRAIVFLDGVDSGRLQWGDISDYVFVAGDPLINDASPQTRGRILFLIPVGGSVGDPPEPWAPENVRSHCVRLLDE